MKRPAKAGDPAERALAASFARLRVAERADAPDFPAVETLQPASGHSVFFRPMLAASLAAGIAAFALFFVAGESRQDQDPVELYASIMAANEITTDQLILTSPGMLPEAGGLPAIYEIEMPAFAGGVQK